MKKHEFVKMNCECTRRTSVYTCKHCGEMEYASPEQLRSLELLKAACTGSGAPEISALEALRGKLDGTFDCLSPDHAGPHGNAAAREREQASS